MTTPICPDPVYLDYAATTPVDPAVAEVMRAYLTPETAFGNPASRQHAYGRQAAEAVEQARASVAGLVGAEPVEIIWTSGATESNNLAIKGAAQAYADRGRHLITLKTEHKSVVDCYRQLEQQGWRVSWLVPDVDGRLELQQLADAISDDTVLVSVMAVNNETGVTQDIKAIGAMTRERGLLLHVDAAQALGKLPLDVNTMQADLVSVSAHKCYGPKGIGALYVRRQPRARLSAQIHGGGHERGLRSGTLPVHQIAGFGRACELAAPSLHAESDRLASLRDYLWEGLSALPEVYRNGSATDCAPNILNLSFGGVDGEALHAGLSSTLAVSSGSACTSASQESSYVLRALGREDELAYASIRFSLGRWTTQADIDQAIEQVTAHVCYLRALSPQWGYQETVKPARPPEGAHPDYSAAVWQSFYDNRRAGAWPAETVGVISTRAQTPGSRAVMQLQACTENGRIEDTRFQVYGCVSAIACGAWLANWLVGKDQAAVEGLDALQIEAALGLAPIKRHCALLAEDAAKTLLENWSQTNEAGMPASGIKELVDRTG